LPAFDPFEHEEPLRDFIHFGVEDLLRHGGVPGPRGVDQQDHRFQLSEDEKNEVGPREENQRKGQAHQKEG